MQGPDAQPQASGTPASGSRDSRQQRASTCLVISGEKETVSERIGKIGFGWYQVQCFSCCWGFVVAESAELAMAAGVVRCIGDEFGTVDNFGLSMLMTMTFAGLAMGTLLSGPIGDCYGRRVPMLLGCVGIPCAALLTYVAPTFSALYGLRFVLGTSAGLGITMAIVIQSEVSPKHLRGICVAAMGLAWCLGEFYAATGLLIMAPDLQRGPWRKLVLWAAGPAVKLLLFAWISPVTRYDTAHWLSARGRNEDMIAAINLMANMNGQPNLSLEECRSIIVEAPPSASQGNLDELVEATWTSFLRGPGGVCCCPRQLPPPRAPLCVFTLAQAVLCFAKDFALYGSGVLWPLAWASLGSRDHVQPAAELLGTALLGVPGVGIAMCLMHMLPRRLALGTAALLCAAAAWALLRLESGAWLGFAGVAVFKLFFPTWQMVTMLLPAEIFPTQVKSCGYSLVTVVGRAATIVAPMVVGLSRPGFLVCTYTLALVAALTAQLLPETRAADIVDAAGAGDCKEPLAPEVAGSSYGTA